MRTYAKITSFEGEGNMVTMQELSEYGPIIAHAQASVAETGREDALTNEAPTIRLDLHIVVCVWTLAPSSGPSCGEIRLSRCQRATGNM